MIRHVFTVIIVSLFSIYATAQKASGGENGSEKVTNRSERTPPIQIVVREIEPGSLKFRIWILNDLEKSLRISIEGPESESYQDDYVSGKHISKVYNLKDLQDGCYKVRVSQGRYNVDKKIIISTETFAKRNVTIE